MRTLFDTIAEKAGRQHGRISHAQLVEAGVDRARVKRWCADGRLRRVHREVYAVGHRAPSVFGELMAATLACGPAANASHASAGHAYRVFRHRPSLPEVTVPSTAGRSRPGIVIHRVRSLHPHDTTTYLGIPMLSVPRVLLDLAPRLSLEDLTQGCHEAWIHHGTTKADIEACIARNPTKKGAGKLRLALGADVTLSELERGFLRLLARHGVPKPRTNIDVAGDKVDCHWPGYLTVELLSFRFHATRQAFEADVARRRRSSHWAYTWGDVFQRGDQTVADLAALLAGAGCQLSA